MPYLQTQISSNWRTKPPITTSVRVNYSTINKMHDNNPDTINCACKLIALLTVKFCTTSRDSWTILRITFTPSFQYQRQYCYEIITVAAINKPIQTQ